ncbi:MAG: nucleoside triphosphate pyrophosphohydrolase [Treponema sp.]|jgi:tetrapyrrole methylase family protein/MazG family protein|nr:nucleoside triphosphate pyrophosphohydrolase [Treponema sp.]
MEKEESSASAGADMTASEAFKALYDTVVTLRGPNGCNWDREQTPSTLRGALIEETYECIEAIDENDTEHIAEELGDLFLLVTMLSYMHEQKNSFSVACVLEKINEKLIRRHPHVFGDLKVKDVAEILDNWTAIKVQKEGRKPKDSILDDVRQGIPPMDVSHALQKKAAKAGFDWPDMNGVAEKIKEELDEVQAAADFGLPPKEASLQNGEAHKLEEELGDLLFSVINLCRFLKVDPSVALRRTNSKFVERFKYVEKKMKETGNEMKKENLELMDKFWTLAKTQSALGEGAGNVS